MSKHILVLGGFSEIHKRIKALGAEISILNTTKKIKPYYSKIYDRVITLPESSSDEAFIEFARAINKVNKINFIATFHEDFQEIAFKISRELGISYDHNLDTINLVNNKFAFRQRLRELNIDNTKSILVDTFNDLNAFMKETKVPIILKPLNSTASTGIWKIESEYPDLEKDFKKYREKFSQYLLCAEEFICGEEYSVEAFTEDRKHKVYCITKKHKNNKNFVEIGHTVPSGLSEKESNEVKKFVKTVLDAIDIKNGPSHTEIMLTNNGPKAIETHVRIGGDMISKLYEIVSVDIDILEMTARNSIGEQVIDKIQDITHYKRYASIWFKEGEIGTVRTIINNNDTVQDENIVELSVGIKEGDQITDADSSFGRLGHVITKGNSAEKTLSAAQEAIAKIKVIMD
ncbi:ATP-grasp domain-containing protein [Bacillus thuringiensis]|uniref:ATP-grasp domain-containing protein n=1 Tax=Bacillus thuringiensis TaxID=1428 RepID=UPI00403E2433